MRMYTEIYINCKFKRDLPEDILKILKYLFSEEEIPMEDLTLPDHNFFKCDRWNYIGHSCSFYHKPMVTNNLHFNSVNNSYYLTSRSDLKNYNFEIEKFFDWINPYVYGLEGSFIGYEMYEEYSIPNLIYLKDGSLDLTKLFDIDKVEFLNNSLFKRYKEDERR